MMYGTALLLYNYFGVANLKYNMCYNIRMKVIVTAACRVSGSKSFNNQHTTHTAVGLQRPSTDARTYIFIFGVRSSEVKKIPRSARGKYYSDWWCTRVLSCSRGINNDHLLSVVRYPFLRPSIGVCTNYQLRSFADMCLIEGARKHQQLNIFYNTCIIRTTYT